MDNNIEKRFSYLNEKSLEELEELKLRTIEELKEYEMDLNDKNISSQQKSETYQDIMYARDLLLYIENKIEQKKDEKHI